MMVINLRVAFALNNKLKKTMPRKKFQHMVKKRNCRVYLASGSLIQINFKVYICFCCFADNFRSSGHQCFTCQITLFKGYSIIPCAPASKSTGIKSRIIFASTMDSIANHLFEDKLEIVGALSEGSKDITLSRFSLATLSFRPTLPIACKEPVSIVLICSIFLRFQAFFQEARLAINCVLVFISS